MPNSFIACDCLTGFNGETQEEFNKAIEFIKSLPLAFVHVFTYSERPDAHALKLPERVPIAERRKRSLVLQNLAIEKKREFYKHNVGLETSVLWEESQKDGYMYGFTDNYIRVRTKFNPAKTNTVEDVMLNNFNETVECFEV